MQCRAIPLTAELVLFVDRAYEQNRTILHGNVIPIEEWHNAFGDDADQHEANFIIIADNQPAAWLKLNGLNKEVPSISMLVVDDSFKRCGVGSFAVHFAEEYIKSLGKSSLLIYATKDNEPAAQCYLKNGFTVAEEINYAVGDGIIRPGYKFKKNFTES